MESRVTAGHTLAFDKLVDLITTLRSENGCPWDRKQTPQSFHPYILEEYHEFVEALNAGNKSETADELGDLLFLVVFVGYMLEQDRVASLEEVMERVAQKMTRRHPHVFGNAQVRDADDVVDAWARIKAAEDVVRARESLLDGIPRSLPALSRSQKLARRAAKVGFDWNAAEDVFEKLDEELGELKEAVAEGSADAIREELGDLLFVVANAARHLGVDSEAALNEASDKFERRFRFIESRLTSQGKNAADVALAEMDDLWNEAKALEKKL
ncbi:MAG: nucleoside triphosphate pyrophosphohydrolase [Pseudomonadota bacterium]